MIEWFKENYQHVFEKALESNSELKEALDWAVQEGVMDMKREVIVKPEDITDFPNIVEFVYKVRCNLFHGSSKRDASIDRMTVVHATTILDGIYRPILEADKMIRKNLLSRLASRPARNV